MFSIFFDWMENSYLQKARLSVEREHFQVKLANNVQIVFFDQMQAVFCSLVQKGLSNLKQFVLFKIMFEI